MRTSGRLGGSVCVAALLNSLYVTADSAHAAQAIVSRKVAANSRLRRGSFRRPPTVLRSSKWLLPLPKSREKARRPGQTAHRDGPQVNYRAAVSAFRDERKPEKPHGTSSSLQINSHMALFVDGDQSGNSNKFQDYHRDPYRRGYALSNGPKLTVSEQHDDMKFPSQDEVCGNDEEMQTLITRLYAAISLRLRYPNRVSLESIYKLYCQLPKYRMLNITWHWRDKLLRVMGLTKARNLRSMLRYFVLLEDVSKCGLTIRQAQWNLALSFSSKNASQKTTKELEMTLQAWKRMESSASIPGNGVTFNILFDVATKAGNFTLADLIYQEMENRGIEYNRFHYVSLIYYFGLKLDSEGIRAAFWDMIESGEQINTVALNCVIAGLLRCGEKDSAEWTYNQMKGLYPFSPDPPMSIPTGFKTSPRVGQGHADRAEAKECQLHIRPDLHTFKLLIQHHAIILGNIKKVAQFLDDMKYLKIPLHPTVFLILFKGFFLHGGSPGSDWSEKKLQGVLSTLCQARNSYGKGFRIECWLVIWALRAVKKCSTTESLETVFHALMKHWDVPESRNQFMHDIYTNILQDRDMKSSLEPWHNTKPQKRRIGGTWI